MTTLTRADWEQRAQQLKIEGRAFINGEYTDAASGETFECLSPVDGRFLIRGSIDLIERRLHAIDLGGVDQPLHVRVEAEAGRALRRVVAARALEDTAAVMDDMRRDMDLGVRPVHQGAVHPDFAGPAEGHQSPPLWITTAAILSPGVAGTRVKFRVR